MITLEQLQQSITQRIQRYNQDDFPIVKRATQTCALLDSQNHILAQEIVSPFAIPRNNLSAMDGYSVAAGSDLRKNKTIDIIGESQAGKPFTGNLQAGQGVRIFTGAVIPDSCDTVIMQENTNFLDIRESLDKSKTYSITLSQTAVVDEHIRKQGEEIESGEVVLTAGKRLNPADISLLANLGVDKVDIYKPLIVGLLATGDELDKNAAAVTEAMHDCDVLISTAGVSVGDYDFLTTVIEKLGQINHYKVAMKPGKPFVFGELSKDLDKPVLYFGLPGNPLSTVVGTLQLIIPALWRLSGVRTNDLPMTLKVHATLQDNIKKSVGRKDFQRGVLSQDDNGNLQVTSFVNQQSHRIKQLSNANSLIVLAQESGNVVAGEKVEVQLFPWS